MLIRKVNFKTISTSRFEYFAKNCGTRGPIVEEPITWVEDYPIVWREPRFDLAELAVLRFNKGLTRKELAKRYGKSEVAIENYFQRLRRKSFEVPGLSKKEIKGLQAASKAARFTRRTGSKIAELKNGTR